MPEPLAPPSPDHYLVSANGRLGDPPLSKASEVARILDLAIGQAPENGLVIHFHGGLVKQDYALNKITASLTGPYRDEAKAYPLFFVWKSGFMEALLGNKQDIVQDPAFRELVKKVSEWVLKKVAPEGVKFRGAGGVTIDDEDAFRAEYDRWFDEKRDEPPVDGSGIGGPPGARTRAAASEPEEDALADEILRSLDNDPHFKEVLQETYNAANPPGTNVTTKGVGTTRRADRLVISADALDEMFPPEEATPSDAKVKTRGLFGWAKVALYVAKLVIAVVRRFRSGRDHGVYCTIVEEVLRSAYGDLIGATIWNAMKKDTEDSFGEGIDTCGLLVVQKLKALEDAGQRFAKITLVGHSTGAIYICNFLDAARRAGVTTPMHVVFLAPAVTCDRFAAALDAHETIGLKDFRMFSMRDAHESEDRLFKPLYTRSLLYFIAGVLEGQVRNGKWSGTIDMPLMGMERFFTVGAFENDAKVQRVWKFLNASPHRMVWSPAQDAGPGLNSNALRHGAFDDDPATVTSLVQTIRAA